MGWPRASTAGWGDQGGARAGGSELFWTWTWLEPTWRRRRGAEEALEEPSTVQRSWRRGLTPPRRGALSVGPGGDLPLQGMEPLAGQTAQELVKYVLS